MMILHCHTIQPDFITTLKNSIHLPIPVTIRKFCIFVDSPIELTIKFQVVDFRTHQIIFPIACSCNTKCLIGLAIDIQPA